MTTFHWKVLQRFALFSLVFLLTFSARTGAAEAMECYQCHGTQTPPDYRPLDSQQRDPASGGFRGNHRTHLTDNASPRHCSVCHPDSDGYTSSHRNGFIDISPAINGSPLPAVYRNGTTAIPQTSAPNNGSCTNVNCHFERETPQWGSSSLTMPQGCTICHGSPPHGGNSGLEGSHGAHDLYFPGVSGCAWCHADHAVEPAPFAHATSVQRRPLVVRLHSIYTSATGEYSGPVDDYLPSQSNIFGNCTNIYCHSKGTGKTGFAPNVLPIWGVSLPDDCSGCHGGDYGSGIEIASGSHTIHVGRDFYGQYIYECTTCHNATASGSRSITQRENHVNGRIDVEMSPIFGGSYSTNGHEPGEAAGSCQNVFCHSDVQPNGGYGGPTVYKTPAWGSGTVNCGGCHVGDGGHGHGGAKISTGSHTKHLTYAFTTTGNTVKCMICHKYTNQPFQTSCFSGPYGNTVCHWGTGAKHANGEIDVRLDPVFGNMSAYQGSRSPGNGYSTCVNTYCHSTGASIATNQVPASTTTSWGSGPITCASCHGNPPSYTSGSPKANSHGKHASYAYGCNRCHYGTTTTGTAITDTTKHVNLSYTISAPSGAFINYSFARTGGTCTANSCHNDGTGVVTGVLITKSATWGSPPYYQCTGCHNSAPDDPAGRPNYVSGSPKGNSHQVYPHNAYECERCHAETATGYDITEPSKHGNGKYDVTPIFAGFFNYSFASRGGGCSSTFCHGSPGYYKWGGIECSDCHDASPDPPTHRKHFDVTTTPVVYGDTTFSQISTAAGTANYFGCGNCHSLNSALHPNIMSGFSVVQLYDITAPAGSLKALNPSTAQYKGAGRITSTIGVDSRGHEYFNGSCSNIYCHSSVIWPSQGMPPELTRQYRTPKWDVALPDDCTGCHGYPPLPAEDSGQINGHSSHTAFECNICHFMTTRNNTTIAATGSHVNGRFDVAGNGSVSFDYTNNRLGSSCSNVSCHTIEPSDTNWGGVAREPAAFTPGPSTLGAPISSSVQVIFAEDMDPASITPDTFVMEGNSGTVTYDPASRTATFTPSEPLAYYTLYTMTLTTGVRNLIGKSLPRSYSWSFTTEKAAPFADVLFEPYAGPGLPQGWTAILNSGYNNWRYYQDRNNRTGGSNGYAAVKNSGGINAELRTPVMDLSSYRAVELQFKTALMFSSPVTVYAEISSNGAAGPWNPIWIGGSTNDYRGTKVINISAIAAGKAAVMIRFRAAYPESKSTDYLEIDDVVVSGELI